jgi:hypothetical protein
MISLNQHMCIHVLWALVTGNISPATSLSLCRWLFGVLAGWLFVGVVD